MSLKVVTVNGIDDEAIRAMFPLETQSLHEAEIGSPPARRLRLSLLRGDAYLDSNTPP